MEFGQSEYLKGDLELPEIEIKRCVREWLDTLPEDKKIEGLITFKNMVENGFDWTFIFECINDQYTDFKNKGFNLIYNKNYQNRIISQIEIRRAGYQDKKIVEKTLDNYLFSDLKESDSAF